MKELKEYIEEGMSSNKRWEHWRSISGQFSTSHLKDISKLTKWSLAKVAGVIDKFENEYGGSDINWEMKDGDLIFKDGKGNNWQCDHTAWKSDRGCWKKI